MKWIKGRQGGDYKKLKIFEFLNKLFGSDCWIIKYSPHYKMPIHIDPVRKKKHYRLNIVFGGKGNFFCERTIFNLLGRIVLFRPDLYKHGLINNSNIRTVLSIGIAF